MNPCRHNVPWRMRGCDYKQAPTRQLWRYHSLDYSSLLRPFNMCLIRRPSRIVSVLLLCFLYLQWLAPVAAERTLDELEGMLLSLNGTDRVEVETFISDWTLASDPDTTGRRPPPLLGVSQDSLGFSGLRERAVACTLGNGNVCTAPGQCCGTASSAWWCCLPTDSCCQASPNGCCSSGTFCCGNPIEFDKGACCSTGRTCCTPSNGKPFVSRLPIPVASPRCITAY